MIFTEEMRSVELLAKRLHMYQKKNRNARTIKAINNAKIRWRKSI